MDALEKTSEDISDWQLVEAVLFSTNHALSVPQIKKITGLKETGKIAEIIGELNKFYREHNRSFTIQKVAGGYQLRSLPKFRQWIRKGKIVKPIQLSPSVMETLAIVAYRQPVTRADVEAIRSVDATYSLKSLLDRKLIKIAGRKEIPGRPLLYATSSFFLEVFGFNTLKDLPRPEEFDILPDQELNIEVEQTGE
ncbi:MAG: SMC-Scp complex subunit ScpB [Proteobacteria bacterium]|nr:SMC-Scp complex subunit ScpB [Pseudomonadota bacterium]